MIRGFTIAFAAGVAFLTAIPAVGADTLSFKPAIKSVTVFGNQAQVRREIDVKVAPGLTAVIFTGLPAGLIDGSSRAGVVNGAASVLRLSESSHTEQASINARTSRIEAEIDSLGYYHRDKIASLISVLEQQKKLLSLASESGSEDLTRQIRESGFEVGSWKAAYTFLGESLTELNDSLRSLKYKEEQFESLIKIKQSELAQLKSQQSNVSRTVTIDIDAVTAGEVTLYLEYLIHGAYWKPVYDFRLVSEDSVEIRYYGEVSQRTGEDWTDVNLTLSTSRPSFVTTPGDFQPRYVMTRPDPFLTKGSDGILPVAPAMIELTELQIRGGRGNEVTYVVDGVPITYSSSGFATTFTVKYPQTVLSGSESMRAPIAAFKMPCELDLICRPSNLEKVFRMAKLTNVTEIPLLEGEVQLFAMEDYVGAANLSQPVFPNQEFEMPFGADESFAVKREIIQEEHEKKGDEWKARQLLSIEITNNGSKMRMIRIEESLPVSRDKAIKIDVKQVVPEPNDRNLNGMAVWEMTIPSHGSVLVEIEYEVKYPANKVLTGL